MRIDKPDTPFFYSYCGLFFSFLLFFPGDREGRGEDEKELVDERDVTGREEKTKRVATAIRPCLVSCWIFQKKSFYP